MSEQIKKHVRSGELSQAGLEYSCNVCQLSLGQQPLQHIKGTSHKNKVFFQMMQNPSRYPSLYSGLPGILTQAHKKGIIRVAGSNLHCVPCGISLSGEAPVLDHLKSKKHVQQVAAQNSTSPPPQPQPQRIISDSSVVLSRDVQDALSNGTIQVIDECGVKKFLCKLCNSSMTGDVPLQQHLQGNSHRKNVKGAVISTVQVPSIASDNFGPKHFRVNTMVAYHRPSDAYRLPTSPTGFLHRGLVAIFNYTFKGTANPRIGAEVDEDNLISVFQQMNYRVDVYRDCSKDETLQHFRHSIQAAARHSAFVAFFLSHGNSPDSFQCNASKDSSIKIQDLYMSLTDSESPRLAGLPKILMFNYCRGAMEQTNIRSDGIGTTYSEAPRDLALVQATLPNFKAKRHESYGTIFVESLCEVLEQHACQSNLITIIRLTSKLMQEKGGTTATVQPIDFRDFFFL